MKFTTSHFLSLKTTFLRILSLFAGALLIIFANSCKKSPSPPSVVIPVVLTPVAIVNLTSTAAQSGGVVTSNGNGTITTNGVCYSATNTLPTTADNKTTDAVSSAGTPIINFTSNLIGLTAGTLYYLRAYATNKAGTGYGKVLKFTTSANLSAVIATVTTFAGNGTAGLVNGVSSSAQFDNPQGLTVDNNGNIYISDSFNSVIREISNTGAVTTFAGNGLVGFTEGYTSTAQFYNPQGLVFDPQGNLYVADFSNNVIRKVTPAGLATVFAGTGKAGSHNGAVSAAYLNGTVDSLAEFNGPQGLALDAQGNMYVADRNNAMIRKISPAGRVTTFAGNTTRGYVDANGSLALFSKPSSVIVDAAGNVYVTDEINAAIRKITPAGDVTTIAGGPSQPDMTTVPTGLAIDKQGNIYISDNGGRVLQYTPAGVLYILGGTLGISGFVDGSGADVKFFGPHGIAVDANGTIYVADQNNNVIRKITVIFKP